MLLKSFLRLLMSSFPAVSRPIKSESPPAAIHASSAPQPSEQQALPGLDVTHRAHLHAGHRRRHRASEDGAVPSFLVDPWWKRLFTEVRSDVTSRICRRTGPAACSLPADKPVATTTPKTRRGSLVSSPLPACRNAKSLLAGKLAVHLIFLLL